MRAQSYFSWPLLFLSLLCGLSMPLHGQWSLTGNAGTGCSASPCKDFIGTTDNSSLEFRVNSLRVYRIEATTNPFFFEFSPNIIGGFVGNNVTPQIVGATIAGGGDSGSNRNSVTDDFGVVGGGAGNQAGNATGTASDANYATVGGGSGNTASGQYSVVGGGFGNIAGGQSSAVAGGDHNSATGASATAAGHSNKASGRYSTVSGGFLNSASGSGSTVAGGGALNNASGTNSTVGGGFFNIAKGDVSIVAGGNGNTSSAQNSTIGGGESNAASGQYSTVSGGRFNAASGESSNVSGGNINNARGVFSTVGGGFDNNALADRSIVAGGTDNIASGLGSTVGGGQANNAEGQYSIVAGGLGNIARGDYSVAGGGQGNIAAGNYSFAGGHGAAALHDGSFVWSDGDDDQQTRFSDSGPDEFDVLAAGGVRLFVSKDLTTGCILSAGDFAWSCAGNRDKQENALPVDRRAILEGVLALPISIWNAKGTDTVIRHLGPTTQDFHSVFHLGIDDSHINLADEPGVALAAIQGLNQKLEDELKKRNAEIVRDHEQIARQQQQLETLQRQLQETVGRLEAIEKMSARPAEIHSIASSTQ